MSMHVYFNPLDVACKNVIGAVKEGEELQLNVFLLKNNHEYGWGNRVPTDALHTPSEEECTTPTLDAFLIFCSIFRILHLLKCNCYIENRGGYPIYELFIVALESVNKPRSQV